MRCRGCISRLGLAASTVLRYVLTESEEPRGVNACVTGISLHTYVAIFVNKDLIAWHAQLQQCRDLEDYVKCGDEGVTATPHEVHG